MNENEKLQAARELITDVLCFLESNRIHEEYCAGQRFAEANKHLPSNHPAWKIAPTCNCIVGRIAEFLK